MTTILPTIEITLRGILVFFIKDGAQTCEVRFLRNPPEDHVLTIDLTRKTRSGTAQFVRQLTVKDIQPSLRLEITNPTQPGVHLYTQRGFDRQNNNGDLNDFRWVVDFENDLYGGPVKVNPDGFLARLTINNGLFFTEKKSIDNLIIKGENDGEDVVFGRVAVGIGGSIYLNHSDSTGVFMNGDEKVLEFFPEPDIVYGINISQSPLPDMVEQSKSADANFYSTVITPDPSLGKQPATFLPPEDDNFPGGAPAISSNAACFTGSSGGDH